VAVWVIASSILGPWIVSKRFMAGASGMADMVVGTHSSAAKVYHVGAGAVGGAIGGLNGSGGGYVSPQANSRMNVVPNYARRPTSNATPKES
jgi:NAD/NADP transhydrogenase alpha subunit